MNRSDRIFFTIVAVFVTAIGVGIVAEVLKSLDHSRTKRTMVALRDTAMQIEEGKKPPAVLLDGWGHPIRVQVVTASHYVLRAAGADGRFEDSPPRGEITKSSEDLVFQDGTFLQYPEGI